MFDHDGSIILWLSLRFASALTLLKAKDSVTGFSSNGGPG